jgi:hypothetical protein
MNNEWTNQDSTAARSQGWDVFEIWDGRLEYEIQKNDKSNIFLSDEAARLHVKTFSNINDLCRKAWALAFRSKTK